MASKGRIIEVLDQELACEGYSKIHTHHVYVGQQFQLLGH